MSTMPGNQHVKDSEVLTEMIGESWIAHEGMTDATGIATVIQANTEATLALAYEQRTANFIAWMDLGMNSHTNGVKLDDEVREAIMDRLGLGGDAA